LVKIYSLKFISQTALLAGSVQLQMALSKASYANRILYALYKVEENSCCGRRNMDELIYLSANHDDALKFLIEQMFEIRGEIKIQKVQSEKPFCEIPLDCNENCEEVHGPRVYDDNEESIRKLIAIEYSNSANERPHDGIAIYSERKHLR